MAGPLGDPVTHAIRSALPCLQKGHTMTAESALIYAEQEEARADELRRQASRARDSYVRGLLMRAAENAATIAAKHRLLAMGLL